MPTSNDIGNNYDVIVVGAGVIGPCVATAMARQGRKVLIVERSWDEPDRIVGELLQPGGVQALQALGMIHAVNNIEAIEVHGYYIKFAKDALKITYPAKADVVSTVHPVPQCVENGNDKLLTDSTLDIKDWEAAENVRGVAFHHGAFLMNLRNIARSEPNVTALEGNVTSFVKDDSGRVMGVRVKDSNGEKTETTYNSKLVFACDGIYSKFRKELSKNNVPTIGSQFVGIHMKNAKLPAKYHGHVILGDHAPILVYQVSPDETRILCAYRSTKAPAQAELYEYLLKEVLPALPEETRPAFAKSLELRKFKVMPNQWLPAKKQGHIPGVIFIGDSLNMRHPLTGGGMTVGLNDVVLMMQLLLPQEVPDLTDHQKISKQLTLFHSKRKRLDAVINTLSIALYTLFAADKNSLKILQKGCFKYFLRGGDCVKGPIGLLSGMLPYPLLLFNHFFSVMFYAIYCNFVDRGLVGFLIAFFEMFETIATAVYIFTPYLISELLR